jgi:large conductance mechanosensitive channel
VLNSLVSFLILALVVFFVVRAATKLMEKPKPPEEPKAPTDKECPFCKTSIPIAATRCPHCTSQLPAAAEGTA